MLFIYSWLVLFLKQLEVSSALYFLAAGWFYRASQKAQHSVPRSAGRKDFFSEDSFSGGVCLCSCSEGFWKQKWNREFQAIP